MNSLTLKSVLYSILISLIPFLTIQETSAQITPDSTLGDESSVVNQLNQLKSLIEGGAVRGENLFHSFLEFNVGNGQSVYFVNPDGVNNILTRVTGANISQILGTLGVNGNANLFLLNPNGFLFGPNAKLDLNGSFTATTGDIQLGEDGVFSATNTQGSSLLNVNPQAVFANFQGQIENRANLMVRDGEKIILMADKVVNTGNLIAPQGLVKLEGNEVNISGNSLIDVSGNDGAGEIKIQGQEEINIGKNVSLKADALLMGDGGKIELISSGKIELLGNISARGENAGEVIIEGEEVINNGVIDLGAETNENNENTIASDDETNNQENAIASDDETNNQENAIASNSAPDAEKTISSDGESENETVIASDAEPENEIAPNSSPEQKIAIASNHAPESEKTIASNHEQQTAIASQEPTPEKNVGADGIRPFSQTQILSVNNPRLQPDGTLGNENTEIESIDSNNDRVIGGAERGINLFHSFAEFNIETGKGVHFANPDGVENILARVTGNNISEIRGTLGVEGSADLYFINPNGLFFNQNASLNLNGSFFATTAEAIIFDEFEYSAVNPNLPPNLVVSVPIGLRFGENPGDIILKNEARFTEQGDTGELLDTAQSVNDNNTPVPNGIQGDLTGGNDADLYRVSLEADKPFSATTVGESIVDTRLFLFDSQGLGIDANEDSEGTFQSTLSEFTPTESGVYYLGISSYANAPESAEGEIFAFNFNTFEFEGLGEGGNSALNGWNQSGSESGGYVISLDNGNETTPTGNFAVNPGQTLALIGDNVTVSGVEINSPGSNVIVGGLNQAGVVNINSDLSVTFPQGINRGDILLINETVLDVAGNDGGSITFNGQNININDSQVLAGIGEGNGFENAQAGDITLDVTDTLEVVENSLIFNNVNFDAVGNSGKVVINAQDIVINNQSIISSDLFGLGSSEGVNIDTDTLSVTNGARINANIFGSGDAREVIINAIDITLGGETSDAFRSAILSTVQPDAEGNSGGIIIDTHTLFLTNGGLISASTVGAGDAGEVIINAIDITLGGETSDGFPSAISSQVSPDAEGKSRGIIIDTDTLSLTNGARINASTFGAGDAGEVIINAIDITLDGETSDGFPSVIFSTVQPDVEGNSGGITIDTDTLSLTNGARISTSTFGVGDAGEVIINAIDITLDGEKSDGFPTGIFSTVEPDAEGNSRGIIIDTDTLFLTNGVQISANTFGTGDAGEVIINAIDITLGGETSDVFPTGIFSTVQPDAEGNSGGINIDTDILSFTNVGQISASTLGTGDAGEVIINAIDITLGGETSDVFPTGIFSTVEPGGEGNSEGITIETDTLSLTNGGVISTSTRGTGDAGEIKITATDFGSISGTIFIEDLNREIGGVSAFTLTTGIAGDIIINTPQLNISEGASIEAFTQGEGIAGDITINATDSIILNTGTKLIVETSDVGIAGNININTPLLTIGENAQLSATATQTSTAEKAGDINLNVNQLNIAGELGIFAETQSIADAGRLTIQPYEIDRQDAYPTNPNLNIQFTENGFISARTTSIGEGGSITITAPENIDIRGNGSITAETFGSGNAGNIDINSQNLTIADQVTITTSTKSSGNAGSILISNGENQANQVNIVNNSTISTEINGKGDRSTAQPANITINSDNLSLQSSQITASTNSNRDAGNINLTGNNFDLDNSNIQALTSGEGNPGSILISNGENNNANQVNIVNDSTISTEINGEGDRSTAQPAKITINSDNFSLQSSEITASTNSNRDAGNISLNNNNISLDNGTITAITQGSGKGGNIDIPSADKINLINNSEISAETTGEGFAGSLDLNVNQIVSIDSGSKLKVETSGSGDAGEIEINTPILTIGENAELSARTSNLGKAGNVTLETNQLNIAGELGIFAETEGEGIGGNLIINPQLDNPNLEINFTTNNGRISASTFGLGEGGDINITAPFSINIDGNGIIKVETQGEGNAGDIEIVTQNLNITGGMEITASTLANKNATISNIDSGDAGKIILDANNINLGDSQINAFTNSNGNAGNINLYYREENSNNITLTNSTISTEIRNNGVADEANNITIKTDNLTADNSTITASTAGKGNTGEINISATDKINLTNNSEISTSVEEGGIGNSQNINISTSELTLNNESLLNAQTAGKGNAGTINLTQMDNLNLNNGSKITTEITNTGNANQRSNINITANQVNLNQNSEISASNNQGRGDAGNINLSTQQLKLNNASKINAFTDGIGSGGSIEISNNGENNQSVKLANDSQISTEIRENGEANQPSDITIKTNNLTVDNSTITASTIGKGNAGDIILSTQRLELNNASQINAFTDGIGSSGSIEISDNGENNQSVTLTNNSEISTEIKENGEANQPSDITIKTNNLTVDNSTITASTIGKGNAGDIILSTQRLELNNQSKINAFTDGIGSGGSIDISDNGENNQSVTLTNNSEISTEIKENGEANQPSDITIKTNNLTVDNSTITASTSGKGDTGVIDLNVSDTLQLNNSEISSSVQQGAMGNSQKITLNTPNLDLNNSEISATTNGQGNAGSIIVNHANTINLDNSIISTAIAPEGIATQPSNITLNTQQLNLTNNSEITASTAGEGDAGQIKVTANTLTSNKESNIQTNTFSSGNAGDIILNLKDNLSLTNSEISSSTAPNSTGKGGNITINSTNTVNLNQQASISVNSQGEGDGGNIDITTENLNLNDYSEISATTASGKGGNITLNVFNTLRQGNNSPISATAGGTGNGGNIKINTEFLIGSGNSDITANAFEGNGGNIEITAEGILRDFSSEITASSQLGVDGIVEINNPNVDPSRGLVDLSQNLVDPNSLIAQNACRQGNQSKFTVRGRGGLPISPEQVLSNDEVSVGLIEVTEELFTPETTLENSFFDKERKFISAQGWRKNEKGQIVLVGYYSMTTIKLPRISLPNCLAN